MNRFDLVLSKSSRFYCSDLQKASRIGTQGPSERKLYLSNIIFLDSLPAAVSRT